MRKTTHRLIPRIEMQTRHGQTETSTSDDERDQQMTETRPPALLRAELRALALVPSLGHAFLPRYQHIDKNE